MRKLFFDSHIMNVMTKFHTFRLIVVATIKNTYTLIHSYEHPRKLLVIDFKKTDFRGE